MNITIQPELEMRLRARAEAEGIPVEAYIERLVCAEQKAEDETRSFSARRIYLRRAD